MHYVTPNAETACWVWAGYVNKKGYAQIGETLNGRHRQMKAHRVAFALFNGPITDDDLILHLCHNRRCVNPAHLRAGTHKDNNVTHRLRIAYGTDPKLKTMTTRELALAKWRGLR